MGIYVMPNQSGGYIYGFTIKWACHAGLSLVLAQQAYHRKSSLGFQKPHDPPPRNHDTTGIASNREGAVLDVLNFKSCFPGQDHQVFRHFSRTYLSALL
jgi:hypothetical protein